MTTLKYIGTWEELEKRGFEKVKDVITDEFRYYHKGATEIDMLDRKIRPYYAGFSYDDYVIIYDLIKDNLVIKEEVK
jgi:adenosine deaminase